MSKTDAYELRINSKRTSIIRMLREVLLYRELFLTFSWRDITVRYKQTFLGVLWVILQPLISTFIFTLLFSNLINQTSSGLPYPLLVLSALIFWNFFSGIITSGSNSLIQNENIIKKVFFPRLILPLSVIITNSVDLLISFALLLLVSIYYSYYPNISLFLVLPISVISVSLFAGGISLFLAALNVKYRDIRYILPFIIQTLFFITPVIYPTSVTSNVFRIILKINPLAGVIESFRSVFLPNQVVDYNILLVSLCLSVLSFLFGLFYFQATERFFADII